MKNLAKYSVDKAITIFMVVTIVIVFGVVSFTNLTTDLFPSMNIPFSVVVTTYPGASPEEVEEVVTEPLEETLATTTNIKEIQSISQENVSVIIMEFNSDTNMDSAVIEMRENLDMITSTFDDEMIGSPMIIKLNPDLMPIMQLSVSKEGFSQQELTQYVNEEVLPLIERVPGVASVSVSGAYESEVRVVLDEAAIAIINDEIRTAMLALPAVQEEDIIQLDKELISNILMAQNFEFPVGYANLAGVDYLVRVGDEFDDLDEIKELAIFNFPGFPGLIDPIRMTVDDVADVSYVNANEKEYSKVNGENAISITIQKSSDFATTDVTNDLMTVITDIEGDTAGVDFSVLLDQGEYINHATGTVTENLLIGAVLAVIVLVLFLRSARATFIVGVSIPISLLFAIILIYFSGITLNIISLGGLALGIGMLVDNSIVVMENIFRMKKTGKSNREAAIEGTKQVAGAITASTITTISVFVPVIFIEGFIREIFMQMALTIAYSLVASLVIALTLVPAISSRVLRENEKDNKGEAKTAKRMKNFYEKVFNGAFKAKYVILAAVVVLFGGFIYLALQNGFEYFPASDEGQLNVSISNPIEDPISYDDFVTVLDDFTDDMMEYEDVEIIGITLGSMQGMFLGITNSGTASASIILSDDREYTTMEMQGIIEDLLADEYPQVNYSVSGSQQQTDMLTGSGISIQLKGYDLDVLKTEAREIATLIGTVEGIESVNDGIGAEADEIKITVNKDTAIQYGITTAQVLGVVAETLAPEDKVTSVTVSGDIYNVYVYDSSSNYSDTTYTLEDIGNFVVGVNFMSPTQDPIYVKDVATVEYTKGFTAINHVDGDRTITIEGMFEEGVVVSEVATNVEKALEAYSVPEGYEYEILGENEEIMEAIETLGLAILLGIALIYMIMASQFQSLTYPFIIMFTIPLAFTGGFAILWVAGMQVSVVSLIGFIVLVGVVVNNGIVLVDYTNQLREEGLEVKEALLQAGKTRMRPIIMTALTTILALSTMALGRGEGSEMMQPMAVTTIGGLAYATVLTLVVVPIMYYALTKHGKLITSIMGIIVFIGGGIAAFQFLGEWYYLLIAAVLVILIILNLVFNRKQDVKYVE